MAFPPLRAIALDRVPNGVEQVLVAEGLRQKLDGAGFHGPDRHGNVAVAGEEDDGQRRVRVGELALEIQPAQPRQAHVEHEASRRVGAPGTHERLSAGEDLDEEPDGGDESPEAVADGRVVVDDEDDGRIRRHGIPGRANWNVAPWSEFVVAHSRPRWLSMIERLIDSPIPSPPGFVV